MSYATQQQLIDRFGEPELIQLTDRASVGIIDAQVLAQAINDTDAEIDGYLRAALIPLPLLYTPNELLSVAIDLVRYRLYDNQTIEVVQARCDQAIAKLKGLKTGGFSLPPDCINVAVTGGTNTATPSSRLTILTEAQLALML